jgi:hypothetical protein
VARPRPEIALAGAAIIVPLAIGVPALQRGQWWLGGVFVALAVAIAAWKAWEWWRATR